MLSRKNAGLTVVLSLLLLAGEVVDCVDDDPAGKVAVIKVGGATLINLISTVTTNTADDTSLTAGKSERRQHRWHGHDHGRAGRRSA